MIKGIIGKKLGMTQVYDRFGDLIAVTVVEAGPCVVTQIKTQEKDGYEALQIAFGDVKEKNVTMPLKGHFAKANAPLKRVIKEVKVDDITEYQLGQEIKADVFAAGDAVKVTGISKGKGFAGAMKRWHFHGGEATHGSMFHRKPASGGATDAARTFKGVRRPGHMGNKQITQRGLSVFRVDAFRNIILIAGSIPGPNGGIVTITKQLPGG
ncbi:MAG: 50S ribosomal protein L3 [Abditibacteriota bacterium]|nr:50S ribosomal protein L3 [Abditibacteriota bacterium]